jgi:hypothetical protein
MDRQQPSSKIDPP